MSMTNGPAAGDSSKAVAAFAAPESFNHKKFFELSGLKKSSIDDMKKVFQVLDKDTKHLIEGDELRHLMKIFNPKSRVLSEKETRAILAAGDKDGDGKISMDAADLLQQKKILELCGPKRETKHAIKKLFKDLDKNNDDYIQENEHLYHHNDPIIRPPRTLNKNKAEHRIIQYLQAIYQTA